MLDTSDKQNIWTNWTHCIRYTKYSGHFGHNGCICDFGLIGNKGILIKLTKGSYRLRHI